MQESKLTQCEMVIAYIEEYGDITPIDAVQELGIMRLASRICDLKKQGFPIVSKMITVKNRRGKDCRVKLYSLEKEGEMDGRKKDVCENNN